MKWFIGRLPNINMKNKAGEVPLDLTKDESIKELLSSRIKTLKIGSPVTKPPNIGPSGFKVID